MYSNSVALRVSKQGVRSAEIGALAFEKSAIELKPKPKQKLLKFKSIVYIMTLSTFEL